MPDPIHYRKFLDFAGAGMLNVVDIGPYLNDICQRAAHIRSPIDAGRTAHALGTHHDEVGRRVNDYIRSAPSGKALPLDYLVCVEDDVSAVFLENHPDVERTSVVTSFSYEQERETALLLYGLLTLTPISNGKRLIKGSEIRGCAMSAEAIHIPSTMQLRLFGKALGEAATTAIEQLMYLDAQGLSADQPRPL